MASAPSSTSHENLFGADGFDCLLADAILKPSAGEFQRLVNERGRVAIAGIFWRESNFYLVAAIAPPGGAHRPKKVSNAGDYFFLAHELTLFADILTITGASIPPKKAVDGFDCFFSETVRFGFAYF